jgi:hypothetical protein
MVTHRLDALIRGLATSRRGILGGTLVVPGWERASHVAAKKRRRTRRPRLNQFGCIDTGDRCDGNSKRCCSGDCAGKKGRRRCRAHDTGGCQPGQSPVTCGGTENAGCLTSRGGIGTCHTTTGNAGYCAVQIEECVACTTDRECAAKFGTSAACVLCPAGCLATGGRACAVISP